MNTYSIIAAVLSAISLIVSVVILIVVKSFKNQNGDSKDTLRSIEQIRRDMLEDARNARQENLSLIQSSMASLSNMMARSIDSNSKMQNTRLSELNSQLSSRQEILQSTVSEMMKRTDMRLDSNTARTEEKLDAIKKTVEGGLNNLRDENNKKLDEMRATVDEKLEKTLQSRISDSFKIVSDRLEQVYRGLGEMQNLAKGVGDLKKVLSNVKTRGVLGEVQLGAILEEILSPEQYDTNVATKHGSQANVEYAIKMPGNACDDVYLPIDAKFPQDAYTKLMDAYESGDTQEIEVAGTELDRRIRSFAKEIHDKYIDPPHTTDFAVMFLPFEGLYAEAARRGLFEIIQRDYKITIAGPTTMAAFLNSLQMGFKTLAIQKRSSEVWNVLGAVKTEFDKFGSVLNMAQQKLTQANSELDKLVGVRTRQIQRKLSSVVSISEENSEQIIAGELNAENDGKSE